MKCNKSKSIFSFTRLIIIYILFAYKCFITVFFFCSVVKLIVLKKRRETVTHQGDALGMWPRSKIQIMFN